MFLIILKFVCWAVTIWFTQVILMKFYYKEGVWTGMFIIQAVAITGLMLLYNIL